MNATWLLSLYPRSWRDGHEPAFRGELERRPATFVDVLDLGLGALDAHLRTEDDPPRVTPDRPTAGIAGAQPSAIWMSSLFGHVAVFIAVNVILAVINLLTDRSTIWFPYALWGTGIALLLHITLTFPGRDFLQAHALLASWIGAGLVGIDIATGDPTWSVWVIWPMASLVVTHALRSRRVIDDFGVHALLTLLGGLELLAVAIVTPASGGDLAMTAGYALVALLAHAMVRFGRARLLPVHLAVFVLVNTLLLIENVQEGGDWWVQYPIVGWSILLAMHILVGRRSPEETAIPDHAGAAIARFADRSALSPATRRLQSFLTHAALFGIATIGFLVMFLISRDDGPWMIWPLGVWLVALNAHAGVLLMPDRPLFAINLFGGATVALGLAAIDASTDGGPWAYWPIAGWLVVLAMHAGIGLAHVRTWFRPHAVGTATAVAVLLMLYATGVGSSWVVWPIWALAILLAIHAGIVALPRQPVLGAWVLTGGAISAGLVLIDMQTGGHAWAYWPIAVWVFTSIVIFGLTIDVFQVIASDSRHRKQSESHG
jgi:hypothetical protein